MLPAIPGNPSSTLASYSRLWTAGTRFEPQTDSFGVYSIRILPGQYRVKSPGVGSAAYWQVSPISVHPRQHVVLDLTSHYLAQ
jgi:hypothetical protein